MVSGGLGVVQGRARWWFGVVQGRARWWFGVVQGRARWWFGVAQGHTRRCWLALGGAADDGFIVRTYCDIFV